MRDLQNDETAGAADVPKYVLVGSNYHDYLPRSALPTYERSTARKTFPRNVTLGFRNNFWRVFSKVQRYREDSQVFEWLGRKWMFCELWMAESRDVDFAAYLRNSTNIFLVFVLRPVDQDEFVPVRSLAFEAGLNEQQTVASLIDAVSAFYSRSHLASFRHSRHLNALFTWSDTSQTRSLEAAVALFAFYSFCLLMTWKIARGQTHIGLRLDGGSFHKQMTHVLRLRSQIINVQRYFLTKNISNDDEIKRIDRSIKQRFRLAVKMEDFLPLNEAIERHLSTAAQLRADRQASTLNMVAIVIATIGLPIAILSMVLAINAEQGVIREGLAILMRDQVSFTLVAVFTASVAVIGGIAAIAMAWRQIPVVRQLEEIQAARVAAEERLLELDGEE